MADGDNPYVGPRPFEREETQLFFGRDGEARELLSLVVAESVVLLYAASGAGKTSLISAGLIPLLEGEEDFDVLLRRRVGGLPDEVVAEALNPYTMDVLAGWTTGGDETLADLSGLTLADFLARRPHRPDRQGLTAPRVVIFDQFEELFTLYPAYWRDREAFFSQVSQALKEDPLLRVLFVIREDYVAQLDPYAALLPSGLRDRFRLDRLGREEALLAVTGPVAGTGRSYAPGVAEKLVADLRKFRVDTGGGEPIEVEGAVVEPVQLQVVCRSLWDELPSDVSEITEEHLLRFGDVDEVLARFYDGVVAAAARVSRTRENRVRRWVEDSFITAVGTRGTVYRGERLTGEIPNRAIDELENRHLIRAEWQRGARWYELTHDRLIGPIRASNARVAARLRKRRNRTLAALLAALVVVAAVALGSLSLVQSDEFAASARQEVVAAGFQSARFPSSAVRAGRSSASLSRSGAFYFFDLREANRPLISVARRPAPGDVSVQVDVQPGGNVDYGTSVICRYQSPLDYYLLAIASGRRYNIVKYVDGIPRSLTNIRTSSAIRPGQLGNQLEGQCSGSRSVALILIANGTRVARVIDERDPYTGGKVALRAATLEPTVRIIFQNFVMARLARRIEP